MSFKWLEKDLGRALKSAGNRDRYQYIVIALLCIIFYLNIFLIVGPSIYFMDPVFRCEGSDRTFDESYACDRLEQCQIINDFTIVAKMDLYCSQQSSRSMIQSSLSIGSLLGLIFMNVVSDIKGRKFALLVDLCLAIGSSLLTFTGATFEITPLLVFSSILSGFSGYSLIIISYIILGDICQESLRQKSSVYINSFLSLGLSSFFIIYNWCNQWYNIIILFMLIPLSGVTVACYLLIEESPNYCLFQMKNVNACTNTLIHIAKINNKTYSDVERIKFLIHKIKTKMNNKKREYGQDTQSNILRSLKKWKYLKVIIFMSIVECGGNMSFYVIAYAINDIGYNFGFMNLALGLTQIVTTFAVGSLVTQLQRKKTLALFYGITPFLSSLFLFQFISSSPFLSTLVILTMRVMTTTGYFMIVMIQTQSFPLQIQSIGAGSIQAFSQLGSIIAPLLNAFSINHGFSRVATMGFVMLLCLIPLVFVQETSAISFKKQIQERGGERSVKSQVLTIRD